MMKALFRFIFSAFKRKGEGDTDAYYLSILYMALIRFALFLPIVRFCASLLDCKVNNVVVILYLAVCVIFSYFRAPQKQSCISNRKYDDMPKLLMYVIAFSLIMISGIGGAFVGIVVEQDIVERYDMGGWLIRYFS